MSEHDVGIEPAARVDKVNVGHHTAEQTAAHAKPAIHPPGTTPAPKPSGSHETAGHKEASWVRTSTQIDGLVHVGSIFFCTKDASVDGRDRELLGELATAYARYATRDNGAHGGDGLRGRVVGFADPRPSRGPDNAQLSQARAAHVWTALAGALDAADVATGYYPFDREGAGAAPGAPTTDEATLEGNALAPFRRADIFVRGKADAGGPASGARLAPREVEPQPPDYSAAVHGLDRWAELVEQGHMPTINGIASLVITHVVGWSGANVKQTLKTIGVTPEKPPWWDSRAAGLPNQRIVGRQALRSADDQRKALLIGKAQLLARDFREYGTYAERHENVALKGYLKAREDGDAALEAHHMRTLGYIVFMLTALEAPAWEVFGGSD